MLARRYMWGQNSFLSVLVQLRVTPAEWGHNLYFYYVLAGNTLRRYTSQQFLDIGVGHIVVGNA